MIFFCKIRRVESSSPEDLTQKIQGGENYFFIWKVWFVLTEIF